MFAVPLVSVVGLWAVVTSITVSSAINNHNYNSTSRAITSRGALLSVGLTDERAQTYLWLATGQKTAGNSMIASRKLVDNALPGARTSLTAGGIPLTPEAESAFRTWGAELGRLPEIRAAIDSGAMTPPAAFAAYTTIIDGEFDTYYSAVLDAGAALAQPAIGATDAAYANEMANRESVLVDGALAGQGTLIPAARQAFAVAAANRKLLMNQVSTLLPPSMSAPYAAIASSAQYRQFQAMEDQISASLGDGGPLPVNANAWQSASQGYLNSMLEAELGSGGQLAAMAASLSDRSLTEAVLAGGLGLIAVVASILLMTWFGRKLTRDLGSLHGSVREMAEERLPRVVERLRRGDDVDVSAESPPPPASDIREISQIARSFATVQEAAVAAAVDQARLRKGISQVFLNISMRSQSLLHRQLGMLDSMERRTSEPTALADLFRLDHLTTRMRRHAEGLIILSGSTPARGWRNPVAVVDVLRAAVAEVEDYVRVDVVSECPDLIAANAVNDAIHLFAELIENATVFSPPKTRIEVRADRVGVGLAVEIEDRGLGMAEEEFAGINKRLARPAEFDPANSEQLGLFVVSRLAARHGIAVTLRRSVYGGTTAILLLPFGVIVRAEDTSAPSQRDELDPASGGPAMLSEQAGRYHRLRAAATGRRADADVTPPPAAEQALSPDRPMTPWAGAFQPRTVRQEPAAAETVSSASHLGMPVRVPQANLAPQLRERGATGPQPVAHDTPVVAERSPEATREMLMSMQHGWERGRMDDLDDPEGAPGNGTGR
jgi:signal transduction histidine kinase